MSSTLLRPLGIIAAVIGLAGITPAAEVTLDSLLTEMISRESMARWPEPAFTCHQMSSYDRSKVAPDQPGWFANNDHTQYLRTEKNGGRTEQVMMDEEGPGCVVRFWLTTVQNKSGTLRIYLDGKEEPELVFPAYDLLAGDLALGEPLAQPHPGYSPADNGGNTLALPIPYAKHCKITWEEKGEGPRFYQIEYRRYDRTTPVRTLTRGQIETARERLKTVNETLAKPPAGEGAPLLLEADLPAGGSAGMDLPAGAAAVREMELTLPAGSGPERERALRDLIVRMSFDGEAAVWCPAGDFFGSGAGLNALHSWYRTVEERADGQGSLLCRWVMPYARAARVELLNVGAGQAKASLRVATGPWQWDARSMHFHSAWHYQAGLKTPPASDWNYVKLEGRGVYVGDTLSLFNPVATWYGEGDEKIFVDGEKFPSHMGTGTEDYYNYSFAPRGIMQTPFANQVRVDEAMTQGHNVLTRTRNLDGIPFRKSLNFDMELIAWKPMSLTYAATTYWYALPGGKSNRTPQPAEAALPVPTLAEAIEAARPKRWPGAVEAEGLKVLSETGGRPVAGQDMAPFGAERWSGGAHLLGKFERVGDFVEIEVPAPDEQPRKLVLHATQAPDYGTLRFSVDGREVARTFDGYAPEVKPSGAVELGVFTPRGKTLVLRVEVAGANPASVGAKYYAGLDCLMWEKP